MTEINYTVGADPEFGIQDLSTGFIYPPICLALWDNIPYEENRIKPEHLIFGRMVEPNIMLHMDGSAFELEIPPTKNPDELFKYLEDGKDLAKGILSGFPNLELSPKPCLPWNIDKYSEKNVSSEIIYANRFGCDPDFNSWMGDIEREEIDATKHPWRYFGGHIHIGVSKEIKSEIHSMPGAFAKFCDIFLGTLCCSKTKYKEEEKLRLFRYGYPGSYRTQNHGFEYRSPSNSWVDNEEVIQNLFIAIPKMLESFLNPDKGITIFNEAEKARDSILELDTEKCSEIYELAIKS